MESGMLTCNINCLTFHDSGSKDGSLESRSFSLTSDDITNLCDYHPMRYKRKISIGAFAVCENAAGGGAESRQITLHSIKRTSSGQTTRPTIRSSLHQRHRQIIATTNAPAPSSPTTTYPEFPIDKLTSWVVFTARARYAQAPGSPTVV